MKYLLSSVLAFILCSTAFAEETSATAEAHHEHHAPHGGSLIEFGEEFAHMELLMDEAANKLTAYALDGEAENAVRLKQKAIVLEVKGAGDQSSTTIQLLPVENPLTGETVGDTSEYASTDAKLKELKQFSGVVLEVEIRGGNFKNVPFTYPSVHK